ERQTGRDSLGVHPAAAAARRRPGGDLRVRRRRYPDGSDYRRSPGAQEALRDPAERPGSDGRGPDHEDEAYQRGSAEARRGTGEFTGVQGRAGGAQEDGTGRDSEGGERQRQARAGRVVPGGARGDGRRRQEEDGGGQRGTERPPAELRVPAVI